MESRAFVLDAYERHGSAGVPPAGPKRRVASYLANQLISTTVYVWAEGAARSSRMIETVALGVVVGYLAIGIAAKILIRQPDKDARILFAEEAIDLVQDEFMWLLLCWIPASVLTGIVMLFLGESVLDVILGVGLVVIVGGIGFAILHYGVWGPQVVLLLVKLRLPGFGFELLLIPALLPIALLILLRAW